MSAFFTAFSFGPSNWTWPLTFFFIKAGRCLTASACFVRMKSSNLLPHKFSGKKFRAAVDGFVVTFASTNLKVTSSKLDT